MLILGEKLLQASVMSLQVGGKIAQTERAIVNPADLSVVAYQVEGPLLDQNPAFLRVADVRELSNIGMIVDSSDEIVALDDVIKIKKLYELNFNPIGMRVADINGKKLGKVEDYTIDTDSFFIQQLSVRTNFFTSLTTAGLMIHRTQIREINNQVIVVESGEKKLNSLQTIGKIHQTYSNPFRTKTAEQQSKSEVS